MTIERQLKEARDKKGNLESEIARLQKQLTGTNELIGVLEKAAADKAKPPGK